MIDIKLEDTKLEWETTDDAEFIYSTVLKGNNFYVRLNDFPEEIMYTLIYENIELLNFDDWPEKWRRPKSSK